MDQVSPGDAGSNSQELPRGTCNNQDVSTIRSHANDPASSSSSLPPNLSPATKSADLSSVENRSAAGLSVLSIYGNGESNNSKPLTDDTPPCHTGQTQDLNLPQKLSTCEKTYRPAQFGPGSFRSVTGPVASGQFDRENLHRVSSESHQQQQNSAGPSRLHRGEYDERALPDWSAVSHGYDPGELFLFNGGGSKDTMRKGVSSQGLDDTRKYESGRYDQENSQLRSGPSNMRSSRDRVPTPGLDAVLGSASTNKTTRDRSDEPASLRKLEPGTSEEGGGLQYGGARYYDYSEGFEPSAPADSPGPVDALPDGIFHSNGIWRNLSHGPQHKLAYVRSVDHTDYYHRLSSGTRHKLAGLQPQGGSECSREYHAPRGGSHDWPPKPVQTRPYAGLCHTGTSGPHSSLEPTLYQNKKNSEYGYPHKQASSVPYHGGYRNVRGYRRETDENGSHHGQQQDAGDFYRERSDFGYHQSVGSNYSKQENMPPSYTYNPRGTAAHNTGPQWPIQSITQAHRRVQHRMKALIPRGLGQPNKGGDGPRIRLSRPLHLAAPQPVSKNIQKRLVENVLSIDDDETLPAGFRNLHDGSSGPSEDGLSDLTAHPLGPAVPSSVRKDEPHLRPDALAGIQIGSNRLRRPRLIARVNSSKKVPTNPKEYEIPKSIDFQGSSGPRQRTPYPADTLTELEYRGVIRTKPKADSDEESRSVIRPHVHKWESAKAMIEGAKEDVLSRLGIKTKRARDAEEFGCVPFIQRAKKAIPRTEHSEGTPSSQQDPERERIEKWMDQAGGENDGAGNPRTEQEELRVEARGNRTNMTTAAGHSAACPSMKERLMHLKERAFRSKPDLRRKPKFGDNV